MVQCPTQKHNVLATMGLELRNLMIVRQTTYPVHHTCGIITLTATSTNFYYSENALKCDNVIKQKSKWAPNHCPGSDTDWLGVPGHGVGARGPQVGSRGTTHYCSPYFAGLKGLNSRLMKLVTCQKSLSEVLDLPPHEYKALQGNSPTLKYESLDL